MSTLNSDRGLATWHFRQVLLSIAVVYQKRITQSSDDLVSSILRPLWSGMAILTPFRRNYRSGEGIRRLEVFMLKYTLIGLGSLAALAVAFTASYLGAAAGTEAKGTELLKQVDLRLDYIQRQQTDHQHTDIRQQQTPQ
jgi:hypothetical protein